MLNYIDNFLNKITMYRLVLYFLTVLLLVATIFGFFGILPYTPLSILLSAAFITLVCWIVNTIFGLVFNAPTNVESIYITAFILALIITPAKSFTDIHYLVFIFWAAVWSQAVKYIFAINKKHIFNPAAFAVALTAITINQTASWWIGTTAMAGFVFIGGILIVRKIRRFNLVFSFFVASLITILVFTLLKGNNIFTTLETVLLKSSSLFFAFIMLTEPLTTPPTKTLQIYYGLLVGFLFAPQVHIGSVYSTPELALLVGNIFAYLVSPKTRLLVKLKERIKISADTYDFLFGLEKKLAFSPGQYMEWTLPHKKSDTRGNRRYFTIASSPTEPELRLGVKFYADSSSFKTALGEMPQGGDIVAAQLAGDFTLPKDKNEKLVFIAGGIGITPFRSMIKYLLDQNEKRDIVLFYSNKTISDIAYADVLTEAEKKFGIKTIYSLTDVNSVPQGWQGGVGYITGEMIAEQVADYKQRTFFISGPQAMVTTFEQTLKKIGVPSSQIKKDFFPGFA